MNFGDFLKSLSIDTWYKMLMYLGAVIFALSLFVDVKGLNTSQVQLISAGMLMFGLGEWKNHKVMSWIKEANFWTGGPALMHSTVWKPDIIGILFDLIGIALLVAGGYSIIASDLANPGGIIHSFSGLGKLQQLPPTPTP